MSSLSCSKVDGNTISWTVELKKAISPIDFSPSLSTTFAIWLFLKASLGIDFTLLGSMISLYPFNISVNTPFSTRTGEMCTEKLFCFPSIVMVTSCLSTGADDEKPLSCSGVTFTGRCFPSSYLPVTLRPVKSIFSPNA